MGLELFVVVGGEEAPGPPAVIVQRHPFAGVLAQVVGTPVPVLFETVLFLRITERRQTKNFYTKRRRSHTMVETLFWFLRRKRNSFLTKCTPGPARVAASFGAIATTVLFFNSTLSNGIL